jgi:hypothetical protein
MLNRSTLVWLGICFVSGALTFRTGESVLALQKELRSLNIEIGRQVERIHLLEADWAFLSDPAKVGEAAGRHLGLKQPGIQQYADISLIPTKAEVAAEMERQAQAEAARLARTQRTAPQPQQAPRQARPSERQPPR